jgi:hypothetical protein
MTTKNNVAAPSKKIVLPDNTRVALRDGWMRTQGAITAAQAAQRAAQEAEQLYKTHFRMCLEMMGLDPDGSWELDMKTGELRLSSADASNGIIAPPGSTPRLD